MLLVFLISSCGDDMSESDIDPTVSPPPDREFSDDDLASEESPSDGEGNGGTSPQAGQITAGEWRDLDHWNFWLNLKQDQSFDQMDEIWQYDITNRVSVKMINSAGMQIDNKKIDLVAENGDLIWSTYTDNHGKAELWAPSNRSNANELKLKIDGVGYDVQFFQNQASEIQMESQPTSRSKIDIALVVDATGSMGDELEFLKSELQDVIGRVKAQRTNVEINLGAVFYRDEGDAYLTRESPFSTDISMISEFIDAQSAGGGGDFPEAVHSALDKALNSLKWSQDALSRVVFLVLDAPPHKNSQVLQQMHELVKQASNEGIKIVPITASGIDKETEFLMRYMAIATSGTYVFITDDSGIGNDHIEASVGQYEVELLNNLMVRLIDEYLQ